MRWKKMIHNLLLAGSVTAATAGIGGSAKAPAAPHAERTVLANGIRLLVIPQPHLPMVVVNALIDAGSRYDPDGREGLASLAAALLTEGTEKKSAADIHAAIDFLGAKLSASAGDDYAGASLTVLKKDLSAGMDLFAEVLLHPAFPSPEFERKRDEALAEIEAEEQNPGALAEHAFRKALFAEGPYRSSPVGWKQSVSALTAGEVRRFYEASYRPDRTILVASGDVTMKEMTKLAESLFGGWRASSAGLEVPRPAPRSGPSIVRIDRDLSQANLVWGHLGTTREDPDWYALQVMNYILGGGGFSSRMMASIRTEAGLAYSVYSYFVPGKLPGSFQVVLQTKSSSTADALARLVKEVERIRSSPVSDEELSAAKKYLTGSFPLRFDSNGEMVSFFAQVEYYGLGLDYPERYDSLIDAVTSHDVLRVANKYLKPESAILVIVGKQGDIKLPPT